MIIKTDSEGTQSITQLCDAALKAHGNNAFALVTNVLGNINETEKLVEKVKKKKEEKKEKKK